MLLLLLRPRVLGRRELHRPRVDLGHVLLGHHAEGHLGEGQGARAREAGGGRVGADAVHPHQGLELGEGAGALQVRLGEDEEHVDLETMVIYRVAEWF